MVPSDTAREEALPQGSNGQAYEAGEGDATSDVALSDPTSPLSLMVRKVTDIVVLPAARLSSNERSLAADVLLHVLAKVSADLREEVAKRISRVSDAPPALVRAVLLDEPAVAGQIIRHADTVPDALLIECAQKGSKAHRIAIARRIDLTSPVADEIVENGELDVAKLLLKREEFHLSPKAINILVSRSTSDVELQGLLLRRRELEPAHGFMMFWWVDTERRKRVLSRFALDRTTIQDSLQDLYGLVMRDPHADPFVKDILVMMDRRHRPRGTSGESVSLDVVIKTLKIARKHPTQEVIHATGLIAGVSRDLAARILRDPTGEPYAVMCKGLSIPRAEFFAAVSDQSGENPFSEQHAEDLLAIFDSMARDYSRAVLRYWDWDANPRIAEIMRLLGIDDS